MLIKKIKKIFDIYDTNNDVHIGVYVKREKLYEYLKSINFIY